MHWFWRKDREHDLDRELRSHLELETAEQQDSGCSLDEASLPRNASSERNPN
jgi:hypothetical protein